MITYKRILDKKFLLKYRSKFLKDIIGNRKYFFASSGRGGLEACIDLLNLKNSDHVLMPALSPEGIVIPFKKRNIKIIYYKSNSFLIPDIVDILQKIKKFNIKIIIIIHYFGFPQPIEELIKKIKTDNIYIIEDCAQAFLSKYKNGNPIGSIGDISFFSFPKFLPVPDGSLFIINNSKIKIEKLKYYFSFLHKISIFFHILFVRLKTIQIKINNHMLYNIFNSILKVIYYIYYKSICYQKNPTKISKYSMNFLSNYDFQKFINKRTENANYIYRNIDKTKYKLLFNTCDSYILTGVPILINNKNRFQSLLKKHKIETLAYRKFWFHCNSDERQNYKNEIDIHDRLLLIPINETISIKQMKYIINILNNVIVVEKKHR